MPFPKGCKKIPKPAFRFFASVFIISGALAGCSATNPNIRQSYDPSADARVRIFVYSADRIRLDFDRRCYGNPGLFGHGDGLETIQRFHDFQGSRSVGMPPTAKRSEAVFDEFIIEAGIPVTVLWQFGGTFGSPFTGGPGIAMRPSTLRTLYPLQVGIMRYMGRFERESSRISA